MDNHILAAIIFLMLSFFIKAVLPLQYLVWHLQMKIHYLVFSYPIQFSVGIGRPPSLFSLL